MHARRGGICLLLSFSPDSKRTLGRCCIKWNTKCLFGRSSKRKCSWVLARARDSNAWIAAACLEQILIFDSQISIRKSNRDKIAQNKGPRGTWNSGSYELCSNGTQTHVHPVNAQTIVCNWFSVDNINLYLGASTRQLPPQMRSFDRILIASFGLQSISWNILFTRRELPFNRKTIQMMDIAWFYGHTALLFYASTRTYFSRTSVIFAVISASHTYIVRIYMMWWRSRTFNGAALNVLNFKCKNKVKKTRKK